MSKKSTKEPGTREYCWAPGFTYKADPNAVGAEIERLLEEHHQQLGAADVVGAARSPLSPMHSIFEWDDTEAAKEYRLEQARRLLRHISVTIITPKGGEVTTRLTVTTETAGNPRKKHYTSTEYALSDPELRAEVLRTALMELTAFRRKYAELSELVHVFHAIDKTRKAI